MIQCKCWNSERRINENIIDQLVGSKSFYAKENKISEDRLLAILVTSTRASEEAHKHAKLMGIVICEKVYLKKHPQIKGFLFHNGDNAELEYRLPFDEDYYDDSPYTYFQTVLEAEEAGYKRVIFKVPPVSRLSGTTHSTIKRTASPIAQASAHMASETQTTQKVLAPQKPSTPQDKSKTKEKLSAFEIFFRAAYILVIFIAIIIVYNGSTMEKGRLISAVITGTIFGYLGFTVIVAIVSGVIGSIKELIYHFK